jgi:hypothetical protein
LQLNSFPEHCSGLWWQVADAGVSMRVAFLAQLLARST